MAPPKPNVSERDVPNGTSHDASIYNLLMDYFFVYALKSKVKNFIYVGYSQNYRKRIQKHNQGEVKSTKSFKPFQLIFLEVYINKSDAKRREKYLKTTKGRTTLKTMLKNTLK